MKKLAIAIFILTFLSSLLTGCSPKTLENDYPSQTDAERIQPGMTAEEVSSIMGPDGWRGGSGLHYVLWNLDNGKHFWVIFEHHRENGQNIYTVQNKAIVDGTLFSGLPDNVLGWHEIYTKAEYEKFLSKQNLPNFVSASGVRCIAEIDAFAYANSWKGNAYYKYYFKSNQAGSFSPVLYVRSGIASITSNADTAPTGNYSSRTPSTNTEDVIVYNRNGLVYTYLSNGLLYSLSWLQNGNYFCLVLNLGSPVENVDELGLIGQLLSESDAEAMAAFQELKDNINSNTIGKPSTALIICGFVFVAMISGVIIICKKRKKKAAAQPTLTQQGPTPEE